MGEGEDKSWNFNVQHQSASFIWAAEATLPIGSSARQSTPARCVYILLSAHRRSQGETEETKWKIKSKCEAETTRWRRIKANNQRLAPHFLKQLQRAEPKQEVSINMERLISSALTANNVWSIYTLKTAWLHQYTPTFNKFILSERSNSEDLAIFLYLWASYEKYRLTNIYSRKQTDVLLIAATAERFWCFYQFCPFLFAT